MKYFWEKLIVKEERVSFLKYWSAVDDIDINHLPNQRENLVDGS